MASTPPITLGRGLGIDFGTSHSRVSYFNPPTNTSALLRFRDYDDLRQYSIPSVIVWNGDHWLFGYEAEEFRSSSSWNPRHCAEHRSLKRQIFPSTSPSTLSAPGGASISLDEALGELLRYVVRLSDEALRARFEGFELQRSSINVSVPVLFDDVARRRLLKAYHVALGREGEPSLIVNEPTAAAFAAYRYARPADFPEGGTVIFDAGAGSTDITVFNRVGQRLFVLGATAAAAGGDDIDSCLLGLIATKLRKELPSVPADLHSLLDAQIAQIRASKERLSTEIEDLCVIVPKQIVVLRSEFEASLEAEVRRMLLPLEFALRGACNGDRTFRVDRIILTGGSSYRLFVEVSG